MNKRKNIIVIFVLTFIMLFSVSATTKIIVTIDGKTIPFSSEPILKNNSVLVPMRQIFEALDAQVDWIASTKSILAKKGNVSIELKIGSKVAYKNGVSIQLVAAPQVFNGVTYVPPKFIAESLGCLVEWSKNTNTLAITTQSETSIDSLTVHYIDVGQADSILIQTPSGKNMLIDAGETKYGAVVSYLKNLDIDKLDVVVATYPDDGHISKMADIINNFEIGNFYMPKVEGTTQSFKDMTNMLKTKKITTIDAKSGTSINLGKGINCVIVAPVKSNYEDLNNWSAVIHLKYGNNSFLFTGDAETISENEILASGRNIKADVLKVGRHGSSGSTSSEFLKMVNPTYAVISVGQNNEYGHPHKEILDRLKNITTYTTIKNGNIVITSDGKKIEVSTSK